MIRIVVLGATGSIGRQTLDIARQHPERLEVVGLAAGSNSDALREASAAFPKAKLALYADPSVSGIPSGMSALIDLATMDTADLVVVSVAGVIGLEPTIAAIRSGKKIALASKEVLVAAGELVMPLVAEYGTTMTPIDSEHSAIFQCLQGYRPEQVERLYLTASGGPFRGRTRKELEAVSVEEALNHPTWRMGGKITVDSATLMNKGLETIEARWLFQLEVDQVETVVHPQSVVHSMVKFRDGSVLGQLGWPDMRLPIQIALLYPEKRQNELRPWTPLDTPSLTFEGVDHETFPSIGIAVRSAKIGGTMPCVMNAANEEAANAFLKGGTSFLAIPEIVEETMARHESRAVSLESLLAADEWARHTARSLMRSPN